MEKSNAKPSKFHYAFVVAAGLSLMGVAGSFINGTNPLFVAPVMAEFGCSTGEYTVTLTLFMLTTGLVTPLMGRLYTIKSLGVRKIELFSVFGCALVCIIRFFSSNIYWWWVSGILLGLFFPCMATLLVPTMVNRWFSRRIGTVMGIIGLIEGVSDIVLNLIGSYIIQSYGWRICEAVWAAMILIIGIPVSFLLRDSPEDVGLRPWGESEEKTALKKDPESRDNGEKAGISYHQALHTSAFWMLVLALAFVTITSTTGFINAHLQSVGYGVMAAGIISAAMSCGKLLGKVTMGSIADHFGAVGSFLFSAACEFVGIMGVAICSGKGAPLPLLAAFTAIAGINSAVGTMAFPIMTREMFGVRDYARIWAQVARWMSLLGALNSVIWGTVTDATGSYVGAFYISSFAGILPVIFILIANKKGKKLQAMWSE